MRHWKYAVTGFLTLLLLVLLPLQAVYCEENEEVQEETEEPIPDSYYYPIESNDVPGWPQGPAIEAASAAVMDLDTGTFLYSKNATAKQYPASTTKIMTALLLVENCNLDDKITFSPIVYDLEEGSSHLGIQPGEEMTLRDAVYGIMLASANDISNGVAEYIGGSLSGFADMMNERAAQLGCINTHFANPHGLFSEDHYTCAHDMALIAQAAYSNPIFREITGTRYYEIPETNLVKETRSFQNHHNMLHSDSEYYRDWCTGGKNGYTEACLNTLVTFGEKDGQRLVGVILRVNGAGKAYEETAQIMEYAFDAFDTRNVDADGSGTNFYDAMGLGSLGSAADFLPELWKQPVAEDCRVSVTVPSSVSISELQHQVSGQKGSRRKLVAYSYGNWPVGTATGTFLPFAGPVLKVTDQTSPFLERNQAVEETSAEEHLQIENLDDMAAWVTGIYVACSRMFLEYTEHHLIIVAVAGLIVLVLILIFLVVLFFRCTSDYRMQKRRKQEEKERQKREEEIERMTTAEIEQELRAVMEEERRKKEQEQREQEEAERASMEARRMEEELRETEELIAELERERQERLKKGINNERREG